MLSRMFRKHRAFESVKYRYSYFPKFIMRVLMVPARLEVTRNSWDKHLVRHAPDRAAMMSFRSQDLAKRFFVETLNVVVNRLD